MNGLFWKHLFWWRLVCYLKIKCLLKKMHWKTWAPLMRWKSCCIMPSLVESKCCRECANLIEDKLDHVKCVAEHEEFETLCLNKIVLNTAFIQYRRYKNNYNLVKQMNNKYVNNNSVIYLTLFLLLLLLIKDFFLTHLLLRLVFIRSFVFLFLSVSWGGEKENNNKIISHESLSNDF